MVTRVYIKTRVLIYGYCQPGFTLESLNERTRRVYRHSIGFNVIFIVESLNIPSHGHTVRTGRGRKVEI